MPKLEPISNEMAETQPGACACKHALRPAKRDPRENPAKRISWGGENPSLELSNEFPPPIFYFLAERVDFSGWSPTASGGGAVARVAEAAALRAQNHAHL